MEYSELLRDACRQLPVYLPGKPIELVARESGLDPAAIVKLASNENPLGMGAKAAAAARQAIAESGLYPDNSGYRLTQALSRVHGLDPSQFVLAAGSNEIFYRLCDLFVEPGCEVIFGAQAFISYRIATAIAGGTPVAVPMPGFTHDLEAMRAAITPRTRLIFLPNPNNPTGTALPRADVEAFARDLPGHVIFCYDEAYAEYQSAPADLRPHIAAGAKVVCTRTFSKIHGLAGWRIGYGYAGKELAALLNAVRPPFNTGNVAQAAALAALDDDAFVQESRRVNAAGQRQLQEGLAALGIEHIPSEANFILAAFPDAAAAAAALQARGVIVRPVANYGLPGHLRISVGTESQNSRFLDVLASILVSKKPPV
ncbi:MAG: histidinol-phosphate transaminase [Opitutales bacterium]|nr:histidinol-phosphate transaminase [Opitutales bacterium]